MKTISKNKSGFTLIELMIVVIIVAILAAVGIPMMQGNTARARLTEGDAGLGTIRTAVRTRVAEQPGFVPVAGAIPAILNFNAGDLTGHYFEDNDFTFVAPAADVLAYVSTYCISATGDAAGGAAPATTAVRGVDVAGVVRSMNDQGSIYPSVNCSGTAIN